MDIFLQYDSDLSELYAELERIENDSEEIKRPPYRNIFYGVADIQEYIEQVKRYREYCEKKSKI